MVTAALMLTAVYYRVSECLSDSSIKCENDNSFSLIYTMLDAILFSSLALRNGIRYLIISKHQKAMCNSKRL